MTRLSDMVVLELMVATGTPMAWRAVTWSICSDSLVIDIRNKGLYTHHQGKKWAHNYGHC